MADPQTLLDLLATDSDVQLRFDDGETVPGHSQVLKLWSGVLRTAIDAEAGSRSGRSFSSEPLTIPLPGTTQEQWLAAAAFMYPLLPSAVADRQNLEALLVIGNKLDCPVLLDKARTFVQLCPASAPPSGWKWIELTDRLSDVETLDLIIQAGIKYSGARAFALSCTAERLAVLTKSTSDRLALALASLVYS